MQALIISFLISLSLTSFSQSFNEKEVAIGELKGTLSIPKKKTKKAILMISGSGPTDRNGNSALGLKNNSLKMVAQSFAESGFAVLRFDKRGIAESKGAVEDLSKVVFDDFIVDTNAWIDFLKEQGYKEIIIAGHSQGSLVGILASQSNSNIIGFISIAGLGQDAGAAIERQLGAQSPELAKSAKVSMDSIRAGHTVKQYHVLLASIFNPGIQPFLRSYIAYDPAEEIKKLKIPALIVNGTNDLQVRVEDANLLKGGYPSAELLIIEGMNHVLKDVPDGDLVANGATYNNPELPLSEGLMEGMISFIKKL